MISSGWAATDCGISTGSDSGSGAIHSGCANTGCAISIGGNSGSGAIHSGCANTGCAISIGGNSGSGAIHSGCATIPASGSDAIHSDCATGSPTASTGIAPCSTIEPTASNVSTFGSSSNCSNWRSPFPSTAGSKAVPPPKARPGVLRGTTARRSAGSVAFNLRETWRGPPLNRGITFISLGAAAAYSIPSNCGPVAGAARRKLGK